MDKACLMILLFIHKSDDKRRTNDELYTYKPLYKLLSADNSFVFYKIDESVNHLLKERYITELTGTPVVNLNHYEITQKGEDYLLEIYGKKLNKRFLINIPPLPRS